jgi:hypothetical protein
MTKVFGNVGSTEEPMLQNFPSDFEYILSLRESVASSRYFFRYITAVHGDRPQQDGWIDD